MIGTIGLFDYFCALRKPMLCIVRLVSCTAIVEEPPLARVVISLYCAVNGLFVLATFLSMPSSEGSRRDFREFLTVSDAKLLPSGHTCPFAKATLLFDVYTTLSSSSMNIWYFEFRCSLYHV